MKIQAPYRVKVKLDTLKLDDSIQMREYVNKDAVLDYAEAMLAGVEFPDVIVFHRAPGPHWVADGFHRVLAAKKAKLKEIWCEIRDGSKRDAILFAMGANMAHGVRRTNSDKRKSVFTMLRDKQWVKWADVEIARRCGVAPSMVGRWRELLNKPAEERTFTRNGKQQTITVPPRIQKTEEAMQEGAEDWGSAQRCPHCGQWM